jgi:hypothetical protein
MRKKFLFIIISTVFSLQCYSQVLYEEGYFINEQNQKVSCLIKNLDWKNNPTNFQYKLTASNDIEIGDIKFIKEFAINNKSKFVKALVKIDRSSENINMLTSDTNPVFNQELLFLKVIVEGTANLYYYGEGSLTRFFYKTNNNQAASTIETSSTNTSSNNEIIQLVYKLYLINGSDYYAKNTYFRNQLFLDLKCEEISTSEIENLQYKTSDLKRLFLKYNECNNSSYINLEFKEEKDLFNLTIRPGLNRNSLLIDSPNDSQDVDFGSKYNLRFGIEAEFILPFNKNKWSVIVEPTYQYYKSEKTKKVENVSGGSVNASIDYQSIELPVGIRHYLFLKNGFIFFANASYIIDFSSKTSIDYARFDGSIYNSVKVDSRNNAAVGVGIKHKDRYSLEIRFQTNRSLLGSNATWKSEYKTASIIFGYSFF